MDYIIYFAITIGILVFIHEFGHFAAAKLTGMRADVFAIGFGKRLFGWNKITGFTFGNLDKDWDGEGHTDYRLCLLPLGGYVKIAGMVDESFDTEFANKEPQPYEFRSKSAWKKMIVISAGVLMNLLLTFAIFWGANFFKGKQVTNTTTLAYVAQDTAADSAGFKTGDKILSINGNKTSNWEELRTEIFITSLGENLKVKLKRNGNIETITVPRNKIPETEIEQVLFLVPEGIHAAVGEVVKNSPAEKAGVKEGDILLAVDNQKVLTSSQVIKLISSNPENKIPIELLRGKDTLTVEAKPSEDGKIGIAIGHIFDGEIRYKTFGFFESMYYASADIANMTELTFSMIGKVFSGKVELGKAFAGPVKIAQIATKSAESGFSSFLFFLALLSLSLALINIMPFPVLDGGHLVIIIIEGITKREIPVKVKIAIQNAGFVLLLLLMAFIIYNDILNI
ncbi:MAG: RIP metalloprotease RseP [Ignavibacteriaceae bacterium]|nr:RIP metalloprotease RseP [Ignavibacteriaceae bacterium]